MPTDAKYSNNHFGKGVPDLPVKDCVAALAYYIDVLGFKKDFDDAILGFERTMFAGVSRGDCAVTLDQHVVNDKSPSGFSCHVDDVDLLFEEFRARGVKVTVEPKDQPWGERGMSIEDPDGNQIHFGSPLRK
jgi:uncharacterized glyoxalase superfamily protein PhnB